MSRPLLFAANWKMHVGPTEARAFVEQFTALDRPRALRTVAFFPPAVSMEATAAALHGRSDCMIGAQNIYWEPKGAYTGEISVTLARDAGATASLVGHSERRHLFGETEEETNRKVRAVLAAGMLPVLCVGEKLLERDRDETEAVVTRQLRVGLIDVPSSANVVIAYEPVWAIGTGRNATPADAARVHAAIHGVVADLGLSRDTRVLYGGSVNRGNIGALLAEPEVDGVLVGGASLDPAGWAEICATKA